MIVQMRPRPPKTTVPLPRQMVTLSIAKLVNGSSRLSNANGLGKLPLVLLQRCMPHRLMRPPRLPR